MRLISVASNSNSGSFAPDQVIFEVTPSFTESRVVEYSPITPVHMPGSIQVYKYKNSRTFTIGAHFISRTVAESTLNMQYVQTLRGWTMPYFGSTTTLDSSNQSARQASTSIQQSTTQTLDPSGSQQLSPEQRAQNAQGRVASLGVELLGAPPDVLYLYAYSTSKNDGSPNFNGDRPVGYGVNLNRIPVVITNLDITYPDDVDYLPTFNASLGIDDTTDPFPIKMDVNISLVETHSPREYEKFDLNKYKLGLLANF